MSGVQILDAVMRGLDAEALAVLEGHMDIETFEFKSPVALRNQERGRAQGREEGREEGRGGQVALVLTVLEAHGLTPTLAERAQIVACADLERLKLWVTRAVDAVSVAEVLEG